MPHVLIVEDSPDELAWMAEVAAGEGWTVATAEALRAARVHLARQQPDVLLTDLQLPDGSGLQLVDDLERPGQTQVIVVTGQASVDSVVQALRAGASDYLLKPLEVPKLQELLRRRSQDGPAPRPCPRRSNAARPAASGGCSGPHPRCSRSTTSWRAWHPPRPRCC